VQRSNMARENEREGGRESGREGGGGRGRGGERGIKSNERDGKKRPAAESAGETPRTLSSHRGKEKN